MSLPILAKRSRFFFFTRISHLGWIPPYTLSRLDLSCATSPAPLSIEPQNEGTVVHWLKWRPKSSPRRKAQPSHRCCHSHISHLACSAYCRGAYVLGTSRQSAAVDAFFAWHFPSLTLCTPSPAFCAERARGLARCMPYADHSSEIQVAAHDPPREP